jgi:flagellar hook-basal body protein
MSFATALSGLNAANNNLSVTGNNIANANTVGFKESVAQFADVYATSLSGNSNITPGSGVNVANDAQQFVQGTLQATTNNLNMAISGSGFFTLAQTPTQTNNLTYSRDGELSLNADGYLVNNKGNALMAYAPNGTSISDGFSTGVLKAVQINTLTGAPAATTGVTMTLNLDASQTLPAVQNGIANAGNTLATAGATLVTAQMAYDQAFSTAGGVTTAAAVVAAQTTLTAAQNALASAKTAAPASVSSIVTDVTTLATDTGQYDTDYQAAFTGGNATPATDATVIADAAKLTTDQAKITTDIQTVSTNTALFDHTNPATYNSQTSLTVYDSLGSPHILTTFYVKGPATNSTTQWDVYSFMSEPATPAGMTPLSAGPYGTTVAAPASTANQVPAVLTFDSNGKLTNPPAGNFALSSYVINPPTGAAPVAITNLDLFGSTQVQSAFSVNTQKQDGLPSGQLTGISIDAQGVISANFSNGGSSPLGQVALTNFPNTNGLQKIGSTQWTQSANSGSPILGTAGSNNFGSIQSGSVEASNVNLSNELVNLIVAQQAYQANAKTITTENNVMTSILQIQ